MKLLLFTLIAMCLLMTYLFYTLMMERGIGSIEGITFLYFILLDAILAHTAYTTHIEDKQP